MRIQLHHFFLLAIVCAIGAATLHARKVSSSDLIEEYQSRSLPGLGFKTFIVPNNTGAFVRVALSNYSETTASGSFEMVIDRNYFYTSSRDAIGVNHRSHAFALSSGSVQEFEFVIRSESIMDRLRFDLHLDGLGVQHFSNRSHHSSFQSFPEISTLMAAHRDATFVANSDNPKEFTRLPDSNLSWEFWEGFNVPEASGLDEATQDRLGRYLREGGFLCVGVDWENGGEEVVSNILGSSYSKADFILDLRQTLEELKLIGLSGRPYDTSASNYPSGHQIYKHAIHQRAVEGGYGTDEDNFRSVVIRKGLGGIVVYSSTNRFARSHSAHGYFGTRGSNSEGESAFMNAVNVPFDSRINETLPVALIFLLLFASTILMAVLPFAYFKKKRAIWLLPGMLVTALGLVLVISIVGAAHTAGGPELISIDVLRVDADGVPVKVVSRDIFIGDAPEDTWSPPSDALFIQSTADGDWQQGQEVSVEDGVISVDTSEMRDGVSLSVDTLRDYSGPNDISVKLRVSGSTLENLGNRDIAFGVFISRSEQSAMFVRDLAAGNSAEGKRIFGFGDLSSELSIDEISSTEMAMLERSLTKLVRADSAFVIMKEPFFEEDEDADETLSAAFVPLRE